MDTFQIDDRHGKLYFMDDSTNKKVYLTVDKNGNLVYKSNPTKIYAKKGKWEEKVQDLGYMWSKKAQKFIPNDDDDSFGSSSDSSKKKKTELEPKPPQNKSWGIAKDGKAFVVNNWGGLWGPTLIVDDEKLVLKEQAKYPEYQVFIADKKQWEKEAADKGFIYDKRQKKFVPVVGDNDNDDDDYENSGSSNKKRKKSTDELVYNSTKKERIAALEFDPDSKSGLVAFYGKRIRYLLVDKKGNLMYEDKIYGTGLFLKNGDWEEKVESLRCRWSKSKKKFIRDNNNNDDNDNDDGNSGSSNKKGKQSKNDTVYEDTKNKKIKQISFDSEKDCLCAIYMHHLWIFTVDEYGNLVGKNKKTTKTYF